MLDLTLLTDADLLALDDKLRAVGERTGRQPLGRAKVAAEFRRRTAGIHLAALAAICELDDTIAEILGTEW